MCDAEVSLCGEREEQNKSFPYRECRIIKDSGSICVERKKNVFPTRND